MSDTFLTVVSGNAAGIRICPEDELVVGRDAEGEGRLGGDPEISRLHASVRRLPHGGLVLEDLGSRNGTEVNGERIDGPRELKVGDLVRVGGTTLAVRDTGGLDTVADRDGGVPADHPTLDQPAHPVEQRGSPSTLHGVLPSSGAAPPAEIVHRGARVPVPAPGLAIGRAPDNDLVLDHDLISRHHARITAGEGRWFIADLDTRNGTYLNGERLHAASRWLNAGDTIEVGPVSLRFLLGQPTSLGVTPAPLTGTRVVRFDGRRLRIGRDAANDVVLDDPNVSRFHAEVVTSNGEVMVRDLESRNGTRLNGRPVTQRPLQPGAEIAVGAFRLVFDGQGFVQRDDRGALRLAVEELTIAVKGKKILNRASLSVQPGEFVAVIGESGSGKTTMIRALAGAVRPSEGSVKVNGQPVTMRLTDIGYVPQDEIVHHHLTVREALLYAAKLRLPKDLSAADRDEAVRRVIEELALEPHGETRIGSLSGGQRKRAGMAAELLHRPSLLFLDEPTTGLDPGLETQMMQLFRELAEEGTRSVTLVTHATKNLGLADKICVMGRGGELSFFGAPEEAKDFFSAQTFDGIYTALDRRPATDWRRDFEMQRPLEPALAPAPPPQEPKRARTGTQVGVLSLRYLKLLVRDRRNLAILIGQVPIIALFIALLFKSNVLDGPGAGRPSDAAQLLFLLVTTSIWLGSIDGSREIIKERALSVREAAVGVRNSAYLLSKAVVLFGLAAVQVALLLAIVFALRPLDGSLGDHLALYGFLCLTAFAGVGMGLFISGLVSTEDQATSFIPLALLPQLLFAGAIVSVKDMSGPIAAASNVVFARWSFSSIGTVVDMNARIAGDPEFMRVGRYPSSFFDLAGATGLALLCGFLALFFAGVAVLLHRRHG